MKKNILDLIKEDVDFFKKEFNILENKVDFDRLFLRLLIVSGIIGAIIAITFLISWFFDIDIRSIGLWTGALIAFFVIVPIFLAPFYWKIAIIVVTLIALPAYISYVLGWSVVTSTFIVLAIIIFILSIYLSI